MNVRNIQRVLESVAPLAYAESWDNVGLLIGDPASRVRKLMLCIDLTEAVLAEALAAKATMVMAYHPILFKDLKKLTADAAPVVYRAARKGIAVYSMHTALDVAPGGTNDVLADVLGLADVRPLEATMQQGRCQIVTFVPADELDAVATAAFDAGAGVIGNYHDCSFVVHGLGTFCGNDETHPTVGQAGRHEAVEEMRVEMVRMQRGEVTTDKFNQWLALLRASRPAENWPDYPKSSN
jgi:dinuclear metal center YbgI/SA1388 family protein